MIPHKPDSAFHEHRDREYITNYFPKIYGTIRNGPTANIAIALVKFRKSDGKMGMYTDLRASSYSVDKNKYYSSKKGITISNRFLLEVINFLTSLPEVPDSDVPDTGNKKLFSINKYPNIDICVSLTKANGSVCVDIREWVRDQMHSYEGFTYKGVRFNYDLISQVTTVLMNIYNDLPETNKQH